jgi:hypothetical protein
MMRTITTYSKRAPFYNAFIGEVKSIRQTMQYPVCHRSAFYAPRTAVVSNYAQLTYFD